VLGFLLLYEATVSDSRFAVRRLLGQQGQQAQPGQQRPSGVAPTSGPNRAGEGAPEGAGDEGLAPGDSVNFTATAYCKGSVTASGVAPKRGVAAADPRLLPVGSVVQLDSVDKKYSGIYTVMDTGPAIRGATIDIYVWSCHEALRFGRRVVQVLLLRRGWDPRKPDAADSILPWRQPNGGGPGF